MTEAKVKAEGFAEDAPALPTPAAAKMTDNKFDGTANPSIEKSIEVDFGPTSQDYPRQTGSDSLTDEDIYLT